jgi:hypothetical protein
MKMEEWDRRIAPRLNKVQGAAGWLEYHAKQLQAAIGGLEARPAWETLAREYLNSAERELLVALAVVRATRDIYDNLPIIVEHAESQAAAE